MHRITLLLILFLLLPDLYIYRMHVVRSCRKRAWRYLYLLPTLLLMIGYVALMYGSGANALAHHARYIGWLAIALLACTLPKVLFTLCSLVGWGVHALCPHCPRRPFIGAGLGIATLCFVCLLYGSLIGVSRFEVKEVEYRSPSLPPAFDGYRIVQLSDIHIGSWQGNENAIRRLVERVNAQGADLILFTGDLVNQRSHELDGFQPILSQLQATDGVYSVLGNHDYGSYYRWDSEQEVEENLTYLKEQQRQMGWQLLNNEHVWLHQAGDSIALIGVENDGEPPFPQYARLSEAMQGTEGHFQLLMSHNPTHWRREVLPQSDIELMLAGHTHAMQAILWGHSLAELLYPEWHGLYQEGERALYVNIGIGYIGLPFRWGAWPEITVITLRRAGM
ncbi:MAG: metallophosphoesterase [Bacteroides sp.]